VDTIEEDETIKVVAEVPGVEKDEIGLDCTEKTITISVDSATKKYYKTVEFPSDVDPTSAQASYRNGVLEVTLNKTKPKTKGRRIEIK
jgi:HSP20 family protein